MEQKTIERYMIKKRGESSFFPGIWCQLLIAHPHTFLKLISLTLLVGEQAVDTEKVKFKIFENKFRNIYNKIAQKISITKMLKKFKELINLFFFYIFPLFSRSNFFLKEQWKYLITQRIATNIKRSCLKGGN